MCGEWRLYLLDRSLKMTAAQKRFEHAQIAYMKVYNNQPTLPNYRLQSPGAEIVVRNRWRVLQEINIVSQSSIVGSTEGLTVETQGHRSSDDYTPYTSPGTRLTYDAGGRPDALTAMQPTQPRPKPRSLNLSEPTSNKGRPPPFTHLQQQHSDSLRERRLEPKQAHSSNGADTPRRGYNRETRGASCMHVCTALSGLLGLSPRPPTLLGGRRGEGSRPILTTVSCILGPPPRRLVIQCHLHT